MEVIPADLADTCHTKLLFYGGVIDIGIDSSGHFVGMIVLGDLNPDDELLIPGSERTGHHPRQLAGLPLQILFDDHDRVVGVRIIGHHRARKIGELIPEETVPELGSGRRSWPSSEDEFERLMHQLDRDAQRREVPIPRRPMEALRIASTIFSGTIQVPKKGSRPRKNCYAGEDFAIRAIAWFDKRYGESLKVSMSPGPVAIWMRASLWEVSIPRVFGHVEFFGSVSKPSFRPLPGTGQIPRFNVLDAVKNLAPNLRAELTLAEIGTVFDRFLDAYRAYECLELLLKYPLARAAHGDVVACVRHLVGEHSNCEQAMWSAQQATEKIMKVALEVVPALIPKTHDLTVITQAILAQGYAAPPDEVVGAVGCSPSVRYGDQSVPLSRAIGAHDAMFSICALVGRQAVQRSAK